MKIALIGYGKMGKEIEKIAINRNHEIALIVDNDNLGDFNSDNLKNIDVAIEFSTPQSATANFITCFKEKVPVVSGTTGWLEHFNEIKLECIKHNTAFFYASNFSLGVNIFFEVNKHLAKIMNQFPEYNAHLEEIHHTQKLDSPSGTALTLANDIINKLDSKKSWLEGTPEKDDQLKITAYRKENFPGTHTITYESTVDKIEITHEAKNRKGFAMGAVLAAEFIFDKKGIFGMKDLLKL